MQVPALVLLHRDVKSALEQIPTNSTPFRAPLWSAVGSQLQGQSRAEDLALDVLNTGLWLRGINFSPMTTHLLLKRKSCRQESLNTTPSQKVYKIMNDFSVLLNVFLPLNLINQPRAETQYLPENMKSES